MTQMFGIFVQSILICYSFQAVVKDVTACMVTCNTNALHCDKLLVNNPKINDQEDESTVIYTDYSVCIKGANAFISCYTSNNYCREYLAWSQTAKDTDTVPESFGLCLDKCSSKTYHKNNVDYSTCLQNCSIVVDDEIDMEGQEDAGLSGEDSEKQQSEQLNGAEDDQELENSQDEIDFQGINENNFYEKIKNNPKNSEIKANFGSKYLVPIEKDLNFSEEQLQLCERDQNEVFQSMEDLQKGVKEASLGIKPIPKKSMTNNVGFITSKNMIFSFYLGYLQMYMLSKLQGKSLKDSEVVKKLIYLKTLLNKMKPVEKKLEYQIQKLIKLGAQANITKKGRKQSNLEEQDDEEEDFTLYKPNPNNMNKKDEMHNESDLSDQDEASSPQKKVQKYVAPKLITAMSKEERIKEKVMKQEENHNKYMRRQMERDLMTDFSNDPNYQNQQDKRKKLMSKEERHFKEREEYEMSNFIRLPITKKEKIMQKAMNKKQKQTDRIDDMTEFENIRGLLKSEGYIDKEKRESEINQKVRNQIKGQRKPEISKKHQNKSFKKRKF